MEGRSVLLAKLPLSAQLKNINISLSPSLKHLILWNNDHISLCSLSKQTDYEHKGASVIWTYEHPDISSALLSDNGQQLALLTKKHGTKLTLYKVNDLEVLKESENYIELESSLDASSEIRENVCDVLGGCIETESILQLHKSQIVIYRSGILTSFNISNLNCNQTYCVQLPSVVKTYDCNRHFFYYIDDNGIIYMYSLGNGNLAGVYNVSKTLPKTSSFSQLCVNTSGSLIALLERSNQLYILTNSKAMFASSFTPHQHNSCYSGEASNSSVSSFKTSVSKTSSYSRVDSLRREITNKKIASIASASSANSSWLAYLENLLKKSKVILGDVEECNTFVCIQDIPNKYVVQSLHFCQDGLGVWATQEDCSSDGFYRVYDKSTGQMESADILAPETKVLPLDSSNVSLDLFLQKSNLCLPLGVISRDTLIQKMVGGEDENQLDVIIGNAVLPLPLLQESLKHCQLDMVRLALNLHTQGFRSRLSEKNVVLDELMESTKQLFDELLDAVVLREGEEEMERGEWRQRVRRLALTHANNLLALLLAPAHTNLQTQILQNVMLLRRGPLVTVELPLIPKWVAWLSLSDEEVILHSVDSLSSVHCFLALHRGWAQEDLEGHRFYYTVLSVVTSLLQGKKLEQALHLLTRVNLDAEEELKMLCLNCRDCALRDYLVNSSMNKLSPEHVEAWKFLTLLEYVFKKYSQNFPRFIESPLNITDIMSFSSKEKSHIVADLFFLTKEPTLESHLEKNACWDYFLSHNYGDGVLKWLDQDTDCKLPLSSQWIVDEEMVDTVLTADCTPLTKYLVCNRLAMNGIFTNDDKTDPEKCITRMAYAEIFPLVKSTLNQDSANLSYNQFLDLQLHHAINNNLIDLAVKLNFDGFCRDDYPAWMKLLKVHATAEHHWDEKTVNKAINEMTLYLSSCEPKEPVLYLKQHPLISVVTDVLENKNVCQLYSHVSPLLAVSQPASVPRQDVSLYSVLARTLPFHTDNIFHHQITDKKNGQLADFSSGNLSLRYGSDYFLGFKEFIKQGRPGSAISFILLKNRSSVKKKAAMNVAHGLALCNNIDPVISCASVAFAELLGKKPSILRTHVAVTKTLVNQMNSETLSNILLQLVQGREDGAKMLMAELERFLVVNWRSDEPSELKFLQDCHLAVRLSVCHHLLAPSSLLQYALETNNWLLIVLAAQIFQYPMTRIQIITRTSENQEMSKHLFHAFQGSSRNQSINEVLTFEPETDLFACLSQVGNDTEMLFNVSQKLNCPALALLASSIQPVPVETGMSAYLVASLSPQQCPGGDLPWSADYVTQLLELVIKKGYIYTLNHAFNIFYPVHPFCALTRFFIVSVVERNFKESTSNLKLFMAAVFLLPEGHKKESSFMMTKSWIAMSAFRMASTALAHCFPSEYLRRSFLKTLCEAKFPDLLQDGQCLPLLLRLSECLADTSLELDWERLLLHQDWAQLPELLKTLTDYNLFDTAHKFAHIASLPVDHILITQWSVLAQTHERKERNFWHRCHDAFLQASISPEASKNFFLDQAANSKDLQERFILLKFTLSWLSKTLASKEDLMSLQIKLYETCLQDNFRLEVVTEGVVPAPLHCLSHTLVSQVQPSHPIQLSTSQYHRLDNLIHRLLVLGDIITAFLLQSLFHHSNQDCELLLACMQLAEGVTTVFQLPTRIQEYLAGDAVRRPKVTFTSPLPRKQSENNLKQQDSQSILNVLYTLQAHQTCPTPLFCNIISGFKISVVLNCDYKVVILNKEPLNWLHADHDFDVATSLLNLASLTRYECAQYVCSQIVTVLNLEPENGKYILWNCDLDNEFSCILDLSGSALLLGNLLLASDPPAASSPQSSFRQVVEMLILAHNCFTRVCHMEGIASVLNLSRSVVNRLLDCCQWPLMVRLLTGVGRYTEMNYIFQILKDNDQFEFLLRKGLDKPQLMAATLEFVRRDKELFSLVAHHFSMYSELAALFEGEAQVELSQLECDAQNNPAPHLSINPHNKACLEAAMSKYTDATEHYIQAKKMKCGVTSIQQAELIAVQLSLMTSASGSSVPCLINLSASEALQLVTTVLSCEQAIVVARAYGVPVDWGAALYHHCVVRGNSDYLHSWTKRHQINKTVVQEVVRRFQFEREINSMMEANMKWFISSVSLLDVKYRVASQLGFKDILQSLLSSPDMAYLKDTVWQSGFKNQLH